MYNATNFEPYCRMQRWDFYRDEQGLKGFGLFKMRMDATSRHTIPSKVPIVVALQC